MEAKVMRQESTINERSTLTFFQFLILVLSIYVLAALFIQAAFQLSPETTLLIERIDFVICLVFISDFFVRLYKAESKLSFLKWGWIDFVSSIPMFDVLRWGRLARVIRILRILRAFRSTKILLSYLFRNRAKGTFATVALISLVIVLFSSIAILNLENAPESNIKTSSDAVWWAFVTITTVGYGDKFPVTHEGRIIAATLMTAGVGLFGTFTAYVASYFLDAEREKEQSEIQALINEVKLLRAQIEVIGEKERVE
jgi:voltage-gated potassium channel